MELIDLVDQLDYSELGALMSYAVVRQRVTDPHELRRKPIKDAMLREEMVLGRTISQVMEACVGRGYGGIHRDEIVAALPDGWVIQNERLVPCEEASR